jgi:hypothetical protein
MTTSNYNVTRDTIITLALRKLGVLEIGDTPDSNTLANANYSLNLFIKQMNTDGLKLWKNSELKIPMTANKTQYILGGGSTDLFYDTQAPSTAISDRPLKAIQGWYRNIAVTPYIDTPCVLLAKQEYNVLGSKYSTGTPNSFFYDIKVLNGILNLYLTPDTFSQTNLEFHMVAQMPLNDITSGSDYTDFPNEWLNCLVWNLADQLAIEYGVPMNYRQEIMTRAITYRNELTNWDVEAASTYFQPDYRSVANTSYSR